MSAQRISIVVQKVRTPHKLLWNQSAKKWLVAATNHTAQPLYLSWAESFVNPYTNALWVARIDETAAAGDRYIAEATDLVCTSFITSGAPEHLIPPERFIQLAIAPGATASWLMERVAKSYWDGFNVYGESLATLIRAGQVPEPLENVQTRA